jgi:hypothetical protein
MSSPAVAAPFGFKSFEPQAPFGASPANTQEIVERVQAVIKQFENGEREIPTPPTEAEREVFVAKLKGMLSELAAQKPADLSIPAGASIPQLPADFDIQSIVEKARAVVSQITGVTDFEAAAAESKVTTTTTTTEFKLPAGVPQIPEGVNVEEIMEKVNALIANLKAEGKDVTAGPPSIPQLPEGVDGEAVKAQVAVYLAVLEKENPSFKDLSVPEKVKAVIAKFDAEK